MGYEEVFFLGGGQCWLGQKRSVRSVPRTQEIVRIYPLVSPRPHDEESHSTCIPLSKTGLLCEATHRPATPAKQMGLRIWLKGGVSPFMCSSTLVSFRGQYEGQDWKSFPG